jgi:hypothetical protein
LTNESLESDQVSLNSVKQPSFDSSEQVKKKKREKKKFIRLENLGEEYPSYIRNYYGLYVLSCQQYNQMIYETYRNSNYLEEALVKHFNENHDEFYRTVTQYFNSEYGLLVIDINKVIV